MTEKFCYFFNDGQHFRRFLLGLAVLAFLAGIGAVLAPTAWAASFSCGPGPTYTANGNLFADDTISSQIYNKAGTNVPLTPTGTPIPQSDPYKSGACTNALGIFGQIICFFKMTIGQIVSTMYCNFAGELKTPLTVAVELFLIILGIFFMSGMTNLTAREATVALLKVGLVWTFAMNADWGIGIAYSFFMGIANEGTNLVLAAAASGGSGCGPGGVSGAGDCITQPDRVFGTVLNYITLGGQSGAAFALPATLTSYCALILFTFFALLLLALPMVGGSILAMCIQYMMLYLRALLAYLTALVLIGFLFVLAPLFISFGLFATTRSIFEQWLKYLMGFSLQIVIVFAFLALLSLIPIADFFTEILGLVRQYDTTWAGFLTPIPITLCSICNYTINSGAVLGGGTTPITCANNNAIPIDKLFSSQDLVQAIVAQVVALWIVGKVMLDFIKKAPAIASDLSGRMPFATLLGNSASALEQVGDVEYAGMDKLEQGVGNLENSLTNPGTYQGWKRAIPAGLLMAPAFAGLFRRASSSDSGAPPGSPGATGGTVTASSYDPSVSSDLVPSALQSAGIGTPGTFGTPAGTLAGAAVTGVSNAFTSNDAAMQGSSFQPGGSFSKASSSKVSSSAASSYASMQGASFAPTATDDGSSSTSGRFAAASATGTQVAKYGIRVSAAQNNLGRDQLFMDDSYQQLSTALNDIEELKSLQASGHNIDPLRFSNDIRVLREANDMYLVALTNVSSGEQRLKKEKKALKDQVPDAKLATGPNINETRDKISQTIQRLELAVRARQILSPSDEITSISTDLASFAQNVPTAESMGLDEMETKLALIAGKLV